MNDWFQYLYEYYDADHAADTIYDLTEGRLYRTEAPSRTLMPYCVMSLISGTIDRTFSDGDIEGARIQFDVFDKFREVGSSTAGDARSAGIVWEALQARFEKATIPFVGASFIVLLREGLPREIIEENVVHISGDWVMELQRP